MTQLVLTYAIDGTGPTALVVPASGSTLGASQPVVVTFNEPMAQAALVLGGDMAPEANAEWNGDATTLTMAPLTAWQSGSARSLVIDGSDVHGNALVRLSLLYAVDATAPTASASPASGATIGAYQSIVVTFSEPIEVTSVVLGGAMAPEAQTHFSNSSQTLTLLPATTWSGGSARGLTVNASDVAGNAMTTLTLAYTVDAQAPAVSAVPSSGATLGPSSIVVLTFGEAIDPPSLVLGGDMAAEAQSVWSNGDRVLDVAPRNSWSAGSRTLSVDAADLFGNAIVQLSLSYTVDGSGPVATFLPGNGAVIGDSDAIVVTFDEPVDIAALSLGGALAAQARPPQWSNGNTVMTLQPLLAWSLGAATLTVDCRDGFGNTSSQSVAYTVVDSTAPTVSVAPADGATVGAATAIVLTFNEPIGPATLQLGGTLAAGATVVWSDLDRVLTLAPSTSWSGGAGTLTVDCADPSGNALSTLGLHFTVDATPPSATVDPTGGTTVGAAQVVVVTFDEAVDPATLTLGGTLGTVGTLAWSNGDRTLTVNPAGGWSDGVGRTLEVSCEDLYGNLLSGWSVSYTIDATAPTVTATPVSGTTIAADQVITFAFNEPIDPSSLVLGGSLAGQAISLWSAGDTTLTISPATAWAGGVGQTLTLNCDDRYGNAVAPVAMTYTVDASPPTFTAAPPSGAVLGGLDPIVVAFDEPVATATFAVSGTMAAEAVLSWSVDASTLTATPLVTWTGGVGRTLVLDGADLFGNTMASATLTYTVDVSGPNASANPAGGATLGGATAIVITFDEVVSPASLVVGGTLAAEGLITLSSGDTVLTVGPSSLWSGGVGRTLTVDAEDLYGNAMVQLALAYDVDRTAPTAVASPANGAAINGTQAIVLTFNEAADPAALVLGGTLAAEASAQWQDGDTRLTLTPVSTWSDGAAQSLDVSFADLYGNAGSLSLIYAVDSTPPVAIPSPADGATIDPGQILTILFSEPVSNVVFGGTLAATMTIDVVDSQTRVLSNATGWPTGAGQTLTMTAGDLAGNAMSLLTVTYTVQSRRVGPGLMLSSWMLASASLGTMLYVANDLTGVTIFDVSTPASPVLVEVLSFPANVYDVQVDGGYLYVAADGAGLYIYDLSTPTAPVLAGHYPLSGWASAHGITISGTYAYLAIANAGLDIVDITDPTAPTQVGRESPGGAYAEDVTVSGSYAYLANYYDGILVVDVSIPASPTLVGSLNSPDPQGRADAVAVAAPYLYVANASEGLWVVSVANPVLPATAAIRGTSRYTRDVVLNGTDAYLADDLNGLVIVDVSTPTAPVSRGQHVTGGLATGVSLSGNIAYVTNRDDGLTVVDVTNPSSPSHRGEIVTTPGPVLGISVASPYAYVAHGNSGLAVVSIATPSAPLLRGAVVTDSTATDVAISGSYAYVADDGNQGLLSVRVSTPASPTVVGSVPMALYTERRVAVSGTYAYVADGTDGLAIVDVSSSAVPSEVARFPTTGEAMGVAVSGTHAFVADGSAGLVIVDISTPTTPFLAGGVDFFGTASDVAVAGTYGYIANGSGLMIVDVINVASPVTSDWIGTPGTSSAVALYSHYALAVGLNQGLTVIDVSDPSAGAIVTDLPAYFHFTDVAVDGTLAYATDHAFGVVVMDLSGLP